MANKFKQLKEKMSSESTKRAIAKTDALCKEAEEKMLATCEGFGTPEARKEALDIINEQFRYNK